MLASFRAVLTGQADPAKGLRFWLGTSKHIFALGIFGYIIVNKLKIEQYFRTDDFFELSLSAATLDPLFWGVVPEYLKAMGPVLLLAIATIIWYFRYSWAVENEMDILVRLYSKANPPDNWEDILGNRWVPALSIGLTFCFIGLAALIDWPELFCLVMLMLSVLDIRGNSVVRQNLVSHFSDPNYKPPPSDERFDFIMRRRQVAEEYWLQKPQLERIGLMLIATIVAFLGFTSKQTFGVTITNWIPYLFLIITIAVNEFTMARWRKPRDRELVKIETEEAQALRPKIEETADLPTQGAAK